MDLNKKVSFTPEGFKTMDLNKKVSFTPEGFKEVVDSLEFLPEDQREIALVGLLTLLPNL
ncbi:hypothetical protein [Calorimonas adulescens]|uniref:Uncharacterized protein n=1 Tax=Calorimonas adulescens TaxID=2606906 RepID=A0A5D8QDQ8_9THEO|nr:hypothetical protein [Calorimonas adulescens]TZE82517.1 hypothetical protein FWJ32_04355 [Calorimonas adulescens]